MMATVAAVNNMGACAHNPRGNLWFNDETTYGHKLLMKMGWSKGKGLGKNEDGIKENVKVKFRNTNSGLGYKDDPYANVMKTEYESILKSLSANYSQKEISSIEEDNEQENENSKQKSRIVKSRLRYPKLFFGKDVTKYSEKDMKSIFICSLPSKDNQEILKDSASSQRQESELEFPKENKTYSSSLSISDYFAVKMKAKKSNALFEEKLNEQSQQQSFVDSKNTNTDNFSTVISEQLPTKKEKLDANDDQGSINDSVLQQTELFEVDKVIENFADASRKKSSKKKRKKSQTSIDESDSLHMNDMKFECTAPKKKKPKLSDDLVCENNSEEISETGKTLIVNSSVPGKKRKKSKVYEYENNSAEILPSHAGEGKISCQIELSPEKALELKIKHKKYHNKKNFSTDTIENSQKTNENLSSNSAEDGLVCNDAIRSKKKKFKKMKKLKSCLKSKTGNYSIRNVSFNENVSYRIIDTDYESVECLTEEFNILQDDVLNEVVSFIDDSKNESENNTLVTQLSSDSHKCNNESAAEVEEVVLDEKLKDSCSESSSSLSKSSGTEVEEVVSGETKNNDSLSNLPSSKSPHYNGWVESQRQALKMEIYKKMLKSIKKHKVLKTSNLLSIKGYGNWGFK